MTPDARARRAGFTLIEALVALSLLLAFAAAIGPLVFQARRIAGNAERRVAAHLLLRSLLEAPFDRSTLTQARDGESFGLHWRLTAEPVLIQVLSRKEDAKNAAPWTPVRVNASVAWGPGQVLTGETVRLARAP